MRTEFGRITNEMKALDAAIVRMHRRFEILRKERQDVCPHTHVNESEDLMDEVGVRPFYYTTRICEDCGKYL
jgi:hypothetical protein